MHIWRYDVRPRNDRDSRGNVIYNVRIVLRHAFERGETEMLNARYLCPENPLHGPPEILSQNLGKFGGEKYRATALHKNRGWRDRIRGLLATGMSTVSLVLQ